MPRTGQNGGLVIDLHGARRRAGEPAADDAQADGALLVRAAVVHREEAVAPLENTNFMGARLHDSHSAVLEVGDSADVDPHRAFSAAALGSSRSASFHPYSRHAFSKNIR